MKLMNLYLISYFKFFISRNPDQKWAITRAAGLFLVQCYLLVTFTLIIGFKIFPDILASVRQFYNSSKLVLQISIVVLSFVLQYLISAYLKRFVNSYPLEMKISRKGKWLVWFTIPMMALIFLLIMQII